MFWENRFLASCETLRSRVFSCVLVFISVSIVHFKKQGERERTKSWTENEVKLAGRTGAGSPPGAADGPFWFRAPPSFSTGGRQSRVYRQNDMDVLTYKQLQSSCPFRLVRFSAVCALCFSWARKRQDFPPFGFRATQSVSICLFHHKWRHFVAPI